MPDEGKHELAIGVVVAVGNALATSVSPEAGVMATLASPFAIAGLKSISATIGSRRQEHAAQTLLDGAEAYGAETLEDFVAFLEAAVSDEEHQELLARALTIAQDTAMRDKRRALGRALAAAASDTGTKVDEELLWIRVLADLDEPHIRVLRILAAPPQRDISYNGTPFAIGEDDPGLRETANIILVWLQRHDLVRPGTLVRTPIGMMQPQFTVWHNGIQILTRLAEPEKPGS